MRSIGRPANLAAWVAPGLVPAALARTGRVRAHLAPAALARAGLAKGGLVATGSVNAALLKATLITAAVAAAILAATPAAHAQDAPAAGQSAPAAPVSTPGSTASQTPSSSAPASTTASSSAPPAAGQAPAGQSTGSKTDPVCFKLTGHCVDGAKAAAKSGTAGSTKTGSTGKQPLNLTAPDVRTVVPESELKEPLPSTEQVTETQEADTVSVKGDQGVPPDVPGGFGAIWWAMNHPSQAWRILAPAE